jgi:hypothetical protein
MPNQLTIHFKSTSDPKTGDPELLVIAKINQLLLVDFAYYGLTTSLPELARSSQKPGEFFIITCHCGDPGCAGIRQGIEVTHAKNQVVWRYQPLWPDPATQPELLEKTANGRPEWFVRGVKFPPKTFVFDQDEYKQTILQSLKRLPQLPYVPRFQHPFPPFPT